jgi:hypothetical protein
VWGGGQVLVGAGAIAFGPTIRAFATDDMDYDVTVGVVSWHFLGEDRTEGKKGRLAVDGGGWGRRSAVGSPMASQMRAAWDGQDGRVA